MELDFSKLIAERRGRKGEAQTPAEPEERKKGSKKNEPGSAGTKPDAKEEAKKELEKEGKKKKVEEAKAEITFSDKVVKALKNKVKEHNEKHSKKVTLSQLKKVYRRGAGAFSSSHRPGKTRGQWAMARVNTFLKMMRGEKVKDSYKKADQDIAKASKEEISNISEEEPFYDDYSLIELSLAKIDLLGAGATLDEIDFSSKDENHELIFAEEKEKKTLNKPFRLPKGSNKKFGVYVKNDKGNVVKVTFGSPTMEIRRDDDEARKSFRARHQCDSNPGPKWKARYWSCRMWEKGKSVSDIIEGSEQLIEVNPELEQAEEIDTHFD